MFLTLCMVLALIPFPGTMAVAAPDNVAQIGDTYYPTLQAAIAAVPDNGTITLLRDITTNSTIDLDSTSSDTTAYNLSLGNFTITGDGNVVTILALERLEGAKTVTLTAGPSGGVVNPRSIGRAIGVYDSNARLNINGGTYTGGSSDCSIESYMGQVVITVGVFNGGTTYGALFYNYNAGGSITLAPGSVASPADWQTINAAQVTVTVPPQAKIGTTEYPTLEQAIAAVPQNQTITLLRDITTSAEINLASTPTATTAYKLDLGNYKITGDGSFVTILLLDDAKTVNFTAGPNGGVVNPGTISQVLAINNANARLNINGGTYTGGMITIQGVSGRVEITAGQFNGGTILGALVDLSNRGIFTIADGSVANPADWKDINAPQVTVTSANKPGDINNDGDVNVRDLSILLENYGLSGTALTNPNADINNDGDVNVRDLSILLENYGT